MRPARLVPTASSALILRRPFRASSAHGARRQGASWVEILVVLAVVIVLLVLLIPATNTSREGARRNLCSERLRVLTDSVLKYESLQSHYPTGTLVPNGALPTDAAGWESRPNWLGLILPHLVPPDVAAAFQPDQDLSAPSHAALRRQRLIEVLCPSDGGPASWPKKAIPSPAASGNSSPAWPYSNYAGNYHDVEGPLAVDNHGMLFVNSQVTRADVTDGVEYTLLISEKIAEVNDPGWLSGSRATLRNTGHAINATLPGATDAATAVPAATALSAATLGGYLSFHPHGVNAAFAGGEIRFVHDNVDPKVWRAFGQRSDGPQSSPAPPGSAP